MDRSGGGSSVADLAAKALSLLERGEIEAAKRILGELASGQKANGKSTA